MTVQINEVSIQNGPLPTGPKVGYGYNPITGCAFMTRLENQLALSTNADWGLVQSPGVTQDVAVDASNLFALCNNTVFRFNVGSGSRHDAGFNCADAMLKASALTLDTSYLYVANISNVARFTKATGAVQAEGFSCLLATVNPIALRTEDSFIYVLTAHRVERYNKSTGVLDASGFDCASLNLSFIDLYVAGDYIYCLTSGSVVRFDKATGTANSTAFTCAADMATPGGLLIAGDFIYVTSIANGHVVRYDLTTGAENVTLFTGKTLAGSKGRLCGDTNYLYVTVPNVSELVRLNLTDGAVNVDSFEYAAASIMPTGLVVHTLAPYPPAFYDRDWYEPMQYQQDTSYLSNGVRAFHVPYAGSATEESLLDLNAVTAVLVDQFQQTRPTVYDLGLVAQITADRQLLWRVKTVSIGGYTMDVWYSSEVVYKYKVGGIYFGGKDYTGPLCTILVDPADGQVGAEHAILDLNEFPVNANNETFVHASCCNYNTTDSRVFCVLDKTLGRMAEIRVASLSVEYFTLLVPTDSEIYQVYYTGRLMYTTYNTVTGDFCLYDAHNNGTLLYTFDLGTFDPAVVPQFSVIN